MTDRSRYWREEFFSALDLVKPVADKHKLTLSEVGLHIPFSLCLNGAHVFSAEQIALRWISHHSVMKREFGDNVLIGASSAGHLEQVSPSCFHSV